MKLLVARHGQTNINKKKCFYGGTDAPLNEEGIKQAEELAKTLERYDYDVIVTAPLRRTKRTAEIVNTKKKEIVLDGIFAERKSSKALAGKPFDSIDYKQFSNYHANIKYEGEYTDMERVQDYVNRIKRGVAKLKEKYDDKTVLLVTSRGTYRALHILKHGIPADGDLLSLDFPNGAVAEFEF